MKRKLPGWMAAGFTRHPSHPRWLLCPRCGRSVTNHGAVWPRHLKHCKGKQP